MIQSLLVVLVCLPSALRLVVPTAEYADPAGWPSEWRRLDAGVLLPRGSDIGGFRAIIGDIDKYGWPAFACKVKDGVR